MSKDWVGAALGASPVPLKESVKHVSLVPRSASSLSRVLGEADLDRPEQAPPPESPEPPAAPDPNAEPDPAGPADLEVPLGSDVQSLASAWSSGDKMTVAQRVLTGLSSFTDLVSLFYGIGMDGAMELARIMDELDSDDETTDEALPTSPAPESEPLPPGRNIHNEQ